VSPHQLQAVRVRQPHHVVHREFPSETVVLNLETGAYHGLNPTGGRMLEELNRATSVAAAAARLATAYEQPVDVVERDVYAFCTGLIERGLLTVEPVVR
jgi:Coenzyme PQQ synthesis protein D (PqqD)